MGLKSFTPATEEVGLPDGDTFAVRGLSLEDIAILLREHYEPIKALFDEYVGEASVQGVSVATGELADIDDLEEVMLNSLQIAPALMADVIARAADEPKLVSVIRRLPAGTQIEALEKILKLTLSAEGGLEKLAETVTRLTGSLTALPVDRSS